MKSLTGFTIVELILAMTLIGITLFGVAAIVTKGTELYALVGQRREALRIAKFAVSRMAREIGIIEEPADITIHTSTALEFKKGGTTVKFTYQAPNLYRNSDLLAKGIKGFSFSYYTLAGVSTTSDIGIIKLDIEADAAPFGSVKSETSVMLRNRYYNGFSY